MPIGNIGQGLAASFSDYLTQERARQRKLEDDDLSYRQELIKSLVARPDVNPAILGKALHDLLETQSAKTGKRKQKGGAEGFLGHTELPISQFLQGIQDGTTPIQGDTTEAMPRPQLPTEAAGVADPQMAELKYKDPFSGGYIDPVGTPGGGFTGAIPGIEPPPAGHQMPVDASRLAQASQDMAAYQKAGGRRPVANQPLLRSNREMAQETGEEQGIIYKARAKGQRDADIEMWKEAGFSDEEIKQLIKDRARGRTAADNFASYVYMLPDGRRFSVRTNTRTGETFDESLNPITVPPEAVRIGIGPENQVNFFQSDTGQVTGTATNRYVPGLYGAEQIPVAPGVRGRTSPDGPIGIFAGPDGIPGVARFPRQGTTPRPAMDPYAQSAPPVQQNLPPPVTEREVPADQVEFFKSKGATQVSPILPNGMVRMRSPESAAVPNAPQQRPQYAQSYRQPSQATVDQISAAENGLELMGILEQTWDPAYTGIIGGRVNAFNQRYNPFSEADPKFRQFQQRWATARNELLRANAGLTQTGAERANTEEQIMRLDDKDENFLPALQILREHFQRKLDAMRRNSGVAVPFPAVP